MYDGQPQPGRNDECWCGSGRKYKKCHHDIDERLQALYEAGEEVPQRSLLKTAADIEGVLNEAHDGIMTGAMTIDEGIQKMNDEVGALLG